jgi:hypothetical protein
MVVDINHTAHLSYYLSLNMGSVLVDGCDVTANQTIANCTTNDRKYLGDDGL